MLKKALMFCCTFLFLFGCTDAISIQSPNIEVMEASLPQEVEIKPMNVTLTFQPSVVLEDQPHIPTVLWDEVTRSLVVEKDTVSTFLLKTEPKAKVELEVSNPSAFKAVLNHETLEITALSPGKGTVIITASQDQFETATLNLEIEVILPTIQLSLFEENDMPVDSIELEFGKEQKYIVEAEPGTATITLGSTEGVNASLKETVLTLKSNTLGTHTLQLQGSAEGYSDSSLDVEINVIPERVPLTLTSKSIVKGSASVIIGNSFSITAKTKAELALQYDEEMLIVKRNGSTINITPKSTGDTQLTVKATLAGYSDNVQIIPITVLKKPLTLKLTKTKATLESNKTETIDISATPTTGVAFEASIDNSIAEVSVSGKTLTITPLLSGNAIVTVTASHPDYSSVSKTVALKITDPALDAKLSSNSASLEEGKSVTVSVKTSVENVKVAAVCNNSDISVNVNGLDIELSALTALSESAKVNITVSKEGYETKTLTFTVNPPNLGDSASGLAAEVLRLVNQERAAQGVAPLKYSNKLASGAQVRAKELVENTSHTRPDGSEFWTVFGVPNIYNYAENFAAGQKTPAEAMKDWMNSPGHRASILNASYTHIGVGIYKDSESFYGTYWIQIFSDQ